MKTLAALALALICAFTTACSLSGGETEPEIESVSGTITLNVPSAAPDIYPAESPSAQDNPVLDNPGEPDKESEEGEETEKEEPLPVIGPAEDEMRAVWFSYLEFQSMLTGRDEEQFTANIEEAFDNVKDADFNTVLVQVRPYGDALYRSNLFPWSYIITGEEGMDPGFDPLEVMIREAKKRSLRIEAWINPYRIRSGNEASYPLSEDNPARQWEAEGNSAVVRFGDGLYYNPANEQAQKLIVDGVKEILENYDVDGIHFDDYFYPTAAEEFDADDYAAFKEQGGTLPLSGWRRENVNQLVRDVYAAVKEISPSVLFGISPQGNNGVNYHTQFIDTAKWLSNEGYVDYICPQIYFGFENDEAPYQSTVKDWERQIKGDSIRLYVGLAPYKIGMEDVWAGEGAAEWMENDDLLRRMVEYAREQDHYAGFAMFRYQFLFDPEESVREQVERELENLRQLF